MSQRSAGDEPLRTVVFPTARWERIAVPLLLTLFVIVGINLIGNDAFEGQDYGFHVQSTFRLLNDPSAWFAQDLTHRPLIYWIALHGFHLTNARAPFQFASFVFLLLNAGALWLLHDCARRCIASPLLRIATLALVAFWPATLVTTVVFAADAMAQPFFALLCWSLLRWCESGASHRFAADNRKSGFVSRPDELDTRLRHKSTPAVPSIQMSTVRLADESTAFAALAGIALALGNFTKFTFILLPAAVLVIALLAWRWRIASPRRVLTLVSLAALAPTAVGVWLHQKAVHAVEREQRVEHHRFNWKGAGDMTWRNLLFPKMSDTRIFAAPGYWDPEIINGKEYLPLLRKNDYSYPALLHLGTYTDVLDFSYGGSQRSGRPRPEPQKRFSQWSVRLGVLFSIPAFIAVALYTALTLRAAIFPASPPRFGVVVWLLLGLNWFVPLVITLPFVENAYQWGYWLPRLVVPALWSFGLCLFTWLDQCFFHHTRLGVALVLLTGLQLMLEIGSVWY